MASNELLVTSRVKPQLHNRKSNICPEASANIFSKWTYSWLNELVIYGKTNVLQEEDLYSLDDSKRTDKLALELEECWQEEMNRNGVIKDEFGTIKVQEGRKPSLYNAIRTTYFKSIAPVGLLRFASDMGTNLSPVLLRYLIQYVTDASGVNPPPLYYGIIYAVALFLVQIYITVLQNRFFAISLTQGLTFKTAFIGAIFRKATRLSTSSRQEYNSGMVTNLVSTDTQRIEAFIGFGHVIWTAPIQFFIIIGLLISLLGPSALAGVALLIILLPLQKAVMGKLETLRKTVAPITDSRVKMIQEIIAGIRVIKFFTWEVPFSKQVSEIRRKEISLVRSRAYTQAFLMAVAFTVPVFSASFSLIIFSLSNPLESSRIFAALALFNQLRFPLIFAPMAIVQYVEVKIALLRIEKLFLANESEKQIEPDPNNEFAIEVTDADFLWESSPPKDIEKKKQTKAEKKAEKKEAEKKAKIVVLDQFPTNDIPMKPIQNPKEPTLTDINIKIPKGKLIAIVGAVGSGKSTLLNSFIGETKRTKGSIKIAAKIGYAPQQAWIQNATVKENILFGLPYETEKYLRVIRDSALEKDLQILPDGDQTQIGERGINLSGGQKQRVNIARLLYYGSDIVMMDDPLSAVDSHVGRYLFENCILKAMHGKTRILVTHQLYFLPQVDYIYVMKNGKIAENGTYDDLIADGSEFSQLMKSYGGADKQKELEADDEESKTKAVGDLKRIDEDLNKNKEKARDVMAKEDRAVGNVKANIWAIYFKAAGGWMFLVMGVIGLIFLEGSRVGSDIWLVLWIGGSVSGFTLWGYIAVYFFLGISQTIFNYLFGIIFAYHCTIAARKLHEKAFAGILHSPVSFFDSTPLGRIINRFSKDQDSIDNTLMDSLRTLVAMFTSTVSTLTIISVTSPWFLAPMVPIAACYFLVQDYYRSTARELKRLEALKRSPLYAHIGEALDGISTIKAYGEQSRFILNNEAMVDGTNSPAFLLIEVARWLSLRFESLGACLTLSAGLFGVLTSVSWFSPALFGLSMTYSLQVTGTLSWTIRQFTEVEIAMNAVERVAYYGFDIAQEPEHIKNIRPVKDWPTRGDIEFKDVTMRYAPDLPVVLNNINIKIKNGEKIGIVGRTGSGKSSIMQALFRMVAPEGQIIIDGIDTSSIGLADLRAGLGIIPQDPVLFSGNFRRNLDPFNAHSDLELWTALEKANIKDKIFECGGLEGEVLDGGENLSVGQRQLLCLSRALLKQHQILVMDEATANVDFETDSIIQKCIREDLKSCTILTIAHRLNTIIDYDRVLVLDKGSIVEFDTPTVLIQKLDGAFRSMVQETGEENMESFMKTLGF